MITNSAEGYNYGLASALPANSVTWTLIACWKAEEASSNLKLRDTLLGPQNIENTKNSARNTFIAMIKKERKSIVLKYDRDASPDVFVKAIVGYYKHDVIDVKIITNIIFLNGMNFRMPIFKLYNMYYI